MEMEPVAAKESMHVIIDRALRSMEEAIRLLIRTVDEIDQGPNQEQGPFGKSPSGQSIAKVLASLPSNLGEAETTIRAQAERLRALLL